MDEREKAHIGDAVYGWILMVSICVIGIIVGWFFDYGINCAVYSKTDIGALFATYGSCFSCCLYPAAGMCLYKGIKKTGNTKPARTLLAVSYFLAVYYSNNYNGSKVRELFGYAAETPDFLQSCAAYLFWVVLYAWVPVVFSFIPDDSDPKALISAGAVILLAGVVSDCANLWLKQVASRPRYKYLITLDDPLSEFRNRWQMRPYLAGSNDNLKSWPSGNMTIAAMMMSLPLLLNRLRKKSKAISAAGYIAGVLFVLLYGYNRMHMGNHFLTDVCFGTLITCLFSLSLILLSQNRNRKADGRFIQPLGFR